MSVLTRLGYREVERMARRHRENFWRDTYKYAFYRRLIGTCLACVLTSIILAILIALAFTPKDFQP